MIVVKKLVEPTENDEKLCSLRRVFFDFMRFSCPLDQIRNMFG